MPDSEVRIGGLELLEKARRHGDSGVQRHADYLEPLLAHGPRRYIDNADVDLRVAWCADRLVPLVVTTQARGSSEICDLRTHYVDYVPMQFRRRGRFAAGWISRLRNAPAALLMTGGGLDRVVYVNNFLFSTNPALHLDAAQVRGLTRALVNAYPRHLLLVRSVNPRVDAPGHHALREAGYRMTRSRTVHLFDSGTAEVTQRRNYLHDRKLLARSPYRPVTDADRLLPAAPRLTALYRGLYLDKHPRHNPAFNGRFFRHLLERQIWEFVGFEHDGSIDAFVSYFVDGEFLIGAAIGYDLERSRRHGLYRIAVMFLLEEARRRGLRVNLSAGADEFKQHRGGCPTHEFDAIYDEHLPWRSRLGLAYLRRASNRGLGPGSGAD